ncbi:phosphatase PAP2 family protein [Roseibium album]|uniref:phosphatase PAP2 family protein n=1 Tax=Roseibium album TaxID=311410 RepID=UPI003BB175EE
MRRAVVLDSIAVIAVTIENLSDAASSIELEKNISPIRQDSHFEGITQDFLKLFPGKLPYSILLMVIFADLLLYISLSAEIEFLTLVPYFFLSLVSLIFAKYLDLRDSALSIQVRILDRLKIVLKGIAFILLALSSLRILNHLTMSIAFPFADSMLAKSDVALGLNWLAYFNFVETYPLLKIPLETAYVLFDAASFAGFILLVLCGYFRRAKFFCEVFLIAATISISIGFLFPALSAPIHFFGMVDTLPGYDKVPGAYHLEHMMALRAADTPVVNLFSVPGLVTFPSFHTAGGVILIICFLRTKLVWPVSAYSLTMIASAPIFGGHYFIDQIAGAMLATAVCMLIAKRSCYTRLFTDF